MTSHQLLILIYLFEEIEVERFLIVQLDVFVRRQASDALEVSAKETLTWEMVVGAYGLDVAAIVVE